MPENIKRYWAYILGFFVAGAAILTVIVYTETVYHWIVPRQTQAVEGHILYDYRDVPFYWPETYDKDKEHQEFIRKSASYVKVNMQNASTVEVGEFHVLLTGQAVLEIRDKDGIRKRFPPSDTFDIGSMAAGERLTLVFWMKRPFAVDEYITITNQFGNYTITPSFIVGSNEYYFYRYGFYYLLPISVLLAVAVLVLSVIVYKLRTKATPAALPTQPNANTVPAE